MQIEISDSLPGMDEYHALFESTGWNGEYGVTKRELHLTLERSYHCVSARDAGRLVGFGRIMSDGILHAMIYEMIVHPDYRGQGIGRDVLARLLSRCAADNIRDVQLFCARGKRSFYEKMGFVARPDDGPGMEYRKC